MGVRWNSRELILATIQALNLFSDKDYAGFLRRNRPPELTSNWFNWFVTTWVVARTVAKDTREQVRTYLDTTFRALVIKDRSGSCVDEAASYIARKGWGSRPVASGYSTSPVSLVSKIAFVFNPDVFVPYDSLAVRGLNELRFELQNGTRNLYGSSYRQYLAAFEAVFSQSDQQVSRLLATKHVINVAQDLGLDAKFISRPRIRRKVVDNLLMQRGRRPRQELA
jgi:hypothetical protein